MPQSAFVQACRLFGAGGIWLPGTTGGVAIDQSGFRRDAVPGAYTGAPWSGAGPDAAPGYDGVASQTSPFVATIPAIADPNTLVAHVNIPTTTESGSFLALNNLGNRGVAIGVGNGTTFESANAGNTLMALNESIAWHTSGTAIPVGWHLLTAVFTTGANNLLYYIDDVAAGTNTFAGLAAGTTTSAYIAGFAKASNRATSCVVGTTAWFPSALNAGQIKHLARCSRKLRHVD